MKTMMRFAIAALLAAWAGAAAAQSSPNWERDYVPPATEWNSLFSSKQDFLGYTPLNPLGGVCTGCTLAGTTINSGTISGGTISGAALTGGTIDSTVIGGLSPSGGNFSVVNIDGGAFTGVPLNVTAAVAGPVAFQVANTSTNIAAVTDMFLVNGAGNYGHFRLMGHLLGDGLSISANAGPLSLGNAVFLGPSGFLTDVALGGGVLPNNFTSGFAQLPVTTSGLPTGTPANIIGSSAPIVVDQTDNKICFWNKTAWKCALGS